MWTIASNSIIAMLIVSACGLRSIIACCKRKCTNNLTRVTPLQTIKQVSVNHEEAKFEDNIGNPSINGMYEESKVGDSVQSLSNKAIESDLKII